MIKKFSFRLEQVLRHRANMLEIKERAMAEVEAQLRREQKVLADLLQLQSEVLEEMAQLLQQPFERLERDLYQQYLSWLRVEQEREHQLIAELETLRAAKRAELIKASQEHRIVERLKERKHGDHASDVARLQQNELDEVASIAFVRGRRLYTSEPGTTPVDQDSQEGS